MSHLGHCRACRGTGRVRAKAWVRYPLGQTKRSTLGVDGVFKLETCHRICVEPMCDAFVGRFEGQARKPGRIVFVTGQKPAEIRRVLAESVG